MSTIRQNLLEVDTAEIITPQVQNGAGNVTFQNTLDPIIGEFTPTGIVLQKNSNAVNFIEVENTATTVEIGNKTNTLSQELNLLHPSTGISKTEVIRKSGSTTVFEVATSGINGRPGVTFRDLNSVGGFNILELDEDIDTSAVRFSQFSSLYGSSIPLKSMQFSLTWLSSGALNAGSSIAFRYETSSGGWGSYHVPFENTKILGCTVEVQRNNGTLTGVPAGGMSIRAVRNNVLEDTILTATQYSSFPFQIVVNGRMNLAISEFLFPSTVWAKDDYLALRITADTGSTSATSLFWACDLWMITEYE